jgi:hypothetical protein
MPNFVAIKLKSFFLLTIFIANFYSVCRCKHMAVSQLSHHEQKHHEKDECCDDEQIEKTCAGHHKPCSEKDGCCGTHAIKFSLLEKQTAEPITFHPAFFAAFIHHFIIPTDISPSIPSEGKIEAKWLHKHSPPDLQSLYQRFLI